MTTKLLKTLTVLLVFLICLPALAKEIYTLKYSLQEAAADIYYKYGEWREHKTGQFPPARYGFFIKEDSASVQALNKEVKEDKISRTTLGIKEQIYLTLINENNESITINPKHIKITDKTGNEIKDVVKILSDSDEPVSQVICEIILEDKQFNIQYIDPTQGIDTKIESTFSTLKPNGVKLIGAQGFNDLAYVLSLDVEYYMQVTPTNVSFANLRILETNLGKSVTPKEAIDLLPDHKEPYNAKLLNHHLFFDTANVSFDPTLTQQFVKASEATQNFVYKLTWKCGWEIRD